jgi:hypothetical protein
MKNNASKFPLPTGKQWPRLPERVEALEQATPLAPYKVFTALLTQSGVDDSISISTGSLQKGVTYRVSGAGGGKEDFSNVGLFDFIDGSSFLATDSVTPNNWDGASLSYNPGAPIAIVLENTIGNVWFTYGSDGIYVVYSDILFNQNTYMIIGNPTWDGGNGFIQSGFDGGIGLISTKANFIDSPSNCNLLINTPIEIRVYN